MAAAPWLVDLAAGDGSPSPRLGGGSAGRTYRDTTRRDEMGPAGGREKEKGEEEMIQRPYRRRRRSTWLGFPARGVG